MKLRSTAICLAAAIAVSNAHAEDKVEVAFDRIELWEVASQLSKLLDKKITIANADLKGRLISIFSPRLLTKSEVADYTKGVLMFRGVGWKSEDDGIVLFRMFDEEEAQRVFDATYRSMMEIPAKRRAVVLPPPDR